MARSVQIHLLDDIDGSAAEETVTFGLDGISYEIDLNASHAKELRASLDSFVTVGRRVGRGGAVTTVRKRVLAATRTDRDQNQAIRSWAKSKKITLSARGRIPRSVIEQYEAEAGR